MGVIVMSHALKLSCATLFFVATSGMALVPNVAFAQRDAGAKIRGDQRDFWSSGRSSGRRIRHAHEWNEGLHEYAKENKTIAPEIAKAHADAIQGNLEGAKKDYDKMRKDKVLAKDTNLAAQLELAEKQLAKARESLKKIHDCCQDASIESAMLCDCCVAFDADLKKALSEHQKLMKMIEGDAQGRKPGGVGKAEK
jgi:hypothetical protein